MPSDINIPSGHITSSIDDESLNILEVEDIIKIYKTGKIETQALRGVSFKVLPEEKLFLIGPSGSGKTTLVSIIAGMVKPTSGKVFWKDLAKDITRSSLEEIIKARRDFAGVIFQDSRLLPHLTVEENIELAGHYAKIQSHIIKERTEFLLQFLGIWDKRDKKQDTLSGGERKRAAIATTLITNPTIIIGDEPTGDLDVITAESILDLFDKINEELGIAICIVTHSQQVATRADRILELKDGIVLGEHSNQILLRKLDKSRLLAVDRQSRLAIPKSILQEIDNPKHFSISIENKNIVLKPITNTNLFNKKPTRTCMICGNLEKNKSNFCSNCGAVITQDSEN
ncbi:MAG: ABC transporter ATP-binding protein [Candidatus Heimdallarchaeaceae archaeon]|jgi:putative ABC transport system ATP-binding protein